MTFTEQALKTLKLLELCECGHEWKHHYSLGDLIPEYELDVDEVVGARFVKGNMLGCYYPRAEGDPNCWCTLERT